MGEPPMRRRDVIAGLAIGAAAWPLAARAQKHYRIGMLNAGGASPVVDVLLTALGELGYVEGKNTVIERRFAEGKVERLRELATGLVDLPVDIIVTIGTPAAFAAKQATATIRAVGRRSRRNHGTALGAVLGETAGIRREGLTAADFPEILPGEQIVLSGGLASGTTINSGGEQEVSGGTVSAAIINNGGNQGVVSGGVAVGTIINSGGAELVISGGTVVSTIVNSGGRQTLFSRGTAVATVVNSGGTQNVGGFLFGGGTASGTIINSGGLQNVSGGGKAVATTIHGGGLEVVGFAGTASGTTV